MSILWANEAAEPSDQFIIWPVAKKTVDNAYLIKHSKGGGGGGPKRESVTVCVCQCVCVFDPAANSASSTSLLLDALIRLSWAFQ